MPRGRWSTRSAPILDRTGQVVPAMLDKTALVDETAWVHNVSQKSKTGFTERSYYDPYKVVPAMLDKTALVDKTAWVHNL